MRVTVSVNGDLGRQFQFEIEEESMTYTNDARLQFENAKRLLDKAYFRSKDLLLAAYGVNDE